MTLSINQPGAAHAPNQPFIIGLYLRKNGDFSKALEHIENSLIKNARNYRSMDLKALILRKIGKEDEALKRAKETLLLDPVDVISLRICGKKPQLRTDTAIEIALEYKAGGFYADAVQILNETNSDYPWCTITLRTCTD